MDMLALMLDVKPQQSFEKFWSAYPRKEKKKEATKAWIALMPDSALTDAILAALVWQRESDQWRRGYVPLPASYLRAERWKDERREQPQVLRSRFVLMGAHREYR